MATVETPDRIMTTGWDSGGGSMIWIILFAFLFMFRGGGFGRDGEGHGGGYGNDRYTRYDADFREGREERYFTAMNAQKERYEQMLRDKDCCCETNANIKQVDCDVKSEGAATRSLMVELEQKELIARQQEKILALEIKLNRRETVDETLAGVSRMLDARFEKERFQGARWYPQYPNYPPYDLPHEHKHRGDRDGYNDFYRYEAV